MNRVLEQIVPAMLPPAAVRDLSVAVILPCYNEQLAIAAVVEQFRRAIPQARIYVYDNNSADASVQIAEAAGATVRRETRQGKGFVVRRMFSDVEADIYVMCDADDTYDACAAPALIDRLVGDGLDMVVGARVDVSGTAYRPAHKFGNWALCKLVRLMFGDGFRDMLSGYRVFSRRFVKSFPLMSQGFEIETELTVHALQLEMPTVEVPTSFKDRAAGSQSKLQTVSDGFRILRTIVMLLKQERPLYLFGMAALLLALLSLALAYPLVVDYLETGLVPRIPTAILVTGMMLLAYLSLFSGLILDTVTRGRHEAKRLRYLELPSIHSVVEGGKDGSIGKSVE